MSESNQWIELTRDCEAVMIPAGHTVLLPQGTKAVITQSLGGSFTVHVPEYGGLLRISSRDADAVGMEPAPEPEVPAASGEKLTPEELEPLVWQQLKTCYDPEIPVNIVDLGLVYDMQIKPLDDGRNRVDVKMTLTAQGCGMGASIAADARYKILGLPGVAEAEVEIVWTPVWNPNMISPEGRAKLGMD
ncbi:MAG TPA: putative Fe-S cluster assembly protein SufT [Candidatus Binatia bacterium]